MNIHPPPPPTPHTHPTVPMMMMRAASLALAAAAAAADNVIPPLSAALEAEIAAMEPTLADIIATATSGAQRGAAYNKTADFVDKWGWRLSGTTNLHEATADLEPMLLRWDGPGMQVRYESANIPHWEREGLGYPESCTLLSPRIGSASQPALEAARQQDLAIMGLGQSEGTPPEGVTAEVLVVTGWKDLWEKRALAQGKIVVYAVDWEGYQLTSHYRSRGAAIAARFGAVATLIRSAASFSIGSPHTGGGGYTQDDTQLITAESSFGKECPFFAGLDLPRDLARIPHAGLATEDSDMLRRMAARGEYIEINLIMGGKMFEFDPRGRNTIAEIRGTDYPDEIVRKQAAGRLRFIDIFSDRLLVRHSHLTDTVILTDCLCVTVISGHIDSWDVGQGAMDDAGPAFVAQQALNVILQMGLKPKRTLRWVGWTTEEQGNRADDNSQNFPGTSGGGAYFRVHNANAATKAENHSIVMELDNGVWQTLGIRLAASAETVAIMSRVAEALEPVGASSIALRDVDPATCNCSNGLGIDVNLFAPQENVPTWALAQQPNNVFHNPVNVDNMWDWEAVPVEQHFQGDYFFYHHTEGDTMTVLDPDQMDLAVATVAVHAFAAANLNSMLPRGTMLRPEPPPPPSMFTQLQEGATVSSLLTAVLGLVVGVVMGCCLKKSKTVFRDSDEMKRMLE